MKLLPMNPAPPVMRSALPSIRLSSDPVFPMGFFRLVGNDSLPD
jgi:hypothetical protein